MISERSRQQANDIAFERMAAAEPILEDVAPLRDVLPSIESRLVLTSGPPMAWHRYTGGQRTAIIGAALYEGLATDEVDADSRLANGEIRIAGCHDYCCVGSLAGVYSPSMPVLVVRNAPGGNLALCNMFEGHNPRRLNYGCYDEGVRERLDHVNNRIAPVIGRAVRRSGGIPLKPVMTRALHMGDELHSRNTAASLLFGNELFPALMALAREGYPDVDETVETLTRDHYFFLRLSMAAAKAIADAGHGVEGSSLVSAMAFNCAEFGVRVSGLGADWYVGPHPEVHAKLFAGHTEEEITWMGGESIIAETVGLGGFAQAAAFPLQAYQGGTPESMVERNLELYGIVHGENPDFNIPYLEFRGTPTGIDLFKVLETGIMPVMDIGIAGREGGQIGAGIVRAKKPCFEAAAQAYREKYN